MALVKCPEDIFGKITEEIIGTAKGLGLKGLYGRAVTVHTYSQQMTQRTGYKECAVLLGCAPADVAFKGIAEHASQRGTYVYVYLPLDGPSAVSLYPPRHHGPIIRRIYSHLGWDSRDFAPSQDSVPRDDHSIIRSAVDPASNGAEIVVRSYGKDCLHLVSHITKDLCIRKIDHITLHLDLADPLTASLCRGFEELGFFFAGIIPNLHFDDTLMLQYLNNVPIDFSQIKLYSDMAKEIVAYIREDLGKREI